MAIEMSSCCGGHPAARSLATRNLLPIQFVQTMRQQGRDEMILSIVRKQECGLDGFAEKSIFVMLADHAAWSSLPWCRSMRWINHRHPNLR